MVKELVLSVSRRITAITWNTNILQTNRILYWNISWIIQSWCYLFSEIWYPFVFISVSVETNLHKDIIHDIKGMFKKKNWTFAIKTLFYNILSTVPFKLVPSTGNTLFPTFLPLLECTFCDVAQFSYRIFLNLRVFKKGPNSLNSSPTSTEGALRLLSAPSGRLWQQTAICPVLLWALVVELHLLTWACAQAVHLIYPTNSLCTCSVQRM